MASLSKPTTAPTLSSSSSFACAFPMRRSAHLRLPRSSRRQTITCKAYNDEEKAASSNLIDRRDMLIALGGMYSVLGANHSALSLPIQPPDVSKCGPATLPPGAPAIDCCPPGNPTSIVDFKLPSPSAPLRVRPAAHLATPEYIAKYKRAVELMRALPADDPRSFAQQAKIHCAYCDGAFDQVGFPDLEIQVHNSWIFFPWHRFYLYFHERILGSLIGDPTFAIPFWSWDTPVGMRLPSFYTDKSSALYDERRDAKHQPPTLIDLDFNGVDPTYTPSQQIDHNLKVMYRQVVSNGKTSSLFLGAAYRAGDQPNPGAGSFENVPHNTVHGWTGDRAQPNGEDMGTFYSAAFDPIFYAHHANIDRVWNVWRGLGGKRKDFSDPDWLDATFLFCDEKAQLVRVKVRDCISLHKLRYAYQDVPNLWLQSRPTPAKRTLTTRSRRIVSQRFPMTLSSAVSVTVARPKVGRSGKEKEEEEEVLVVDGIQLSNESYIKFDVYVNTPEEQGVSPAASEFAGSFVNLPHKHRRSGETGPGHVINTVLRLGITDLLEDLEAEGDESVVVTIVPRKGQGKVKVGGVRIEFAS